MEANFKTIGAKAVLSFNDGTQQKFNDILSLCLYAFNKKITLKNAEKLPKYAKHVYNKGDVII